MKHPFSLLQKKSLAILQSSRQTLIGDFLAGVTGAVAGAPQAMGFAIIAGVNPIYSLYTAIVATVVGALTSGSTFMTIAPTNAVALVVGSTLMRFDEGNQIEMLFLLTFIVGIFQLAFGVLRLGRVTRFFSNAVMTGFISGAGLLIIIGQLKHITGYTVHSSGALPGLWEWLTRLGESDGQTLVIGVMAISIIVTLHHTRLKNIATLCALIVTALLIAILNWNSVELVKDLSEVPSGLPSLIVPNWSFMSDLLIPGLALAILALVQSTALTQMMPEPDGSIADVNRDFMGQGFANIASSFFQGMPSGGSLSRTAVNISAGSRSRLANVFAGLMIALIVMLLGKYIERIALAGLAGHLVVAAFSLFKVKNIVTVWHVNRTARVSMLVTFVSTLLLPLEYSIYIGVALSLGLYVYQSSSKLKVIRLIPFGVNQFREAPIPEKLDSHHPMILSVTGNLYFAAAKRLEELLPLPNGVHHPTVILRMRNNRYLGSTGLQALQRYAEQLEAAGGKLILSGISPDIRGELERTGVLQDLGEDNVFFADEVLFSATQHAWDYAEKWLVEHDES